MEPTLRNAEERLDAWLRRHCPRNAVSVAAMRGLAAELVAGEPRLRTDLSELRRRVIERSLRSSGYAAEAAEALSRDALEAFLAARNEVVFFDGALEVLAELRGGYRLAALTNGNADIVRLGLDATFEFALSAFDVGARKPAPDLFQAALRRAGVAPAEMVYVGDDPANDIAPARSLGVHTVWLDHGVHEAASVGGLRIGALRQLPAAIRSLERALTEPSESGESGP
jgi:putative hydrolase of the HAD superfamily